MSPTERSVALTVGETMALFDAQDTRAPAYGSGFALRMAGAESNFAIGLQRLGVQTRWLSRVGDDVLGQLIVAAARDEGVDVSGVVIDPTRSTGIFMKWREGGRTARAYFRRGSAASALSVEDLPPGVLDDVAWVHVTGITLALSPASAEAVNVLAAQAAARSVPVSFDLNFRPALWEDPETAATAAAQILPHVGWVLCGLEEGEALFGTADPARLGDALRAAGAGGAVIRVGVDGAWVVRDSSAHVPIGALEREVLDEVGAGDAFAAGFVAGMLAGHEPATSVTIAHAVAARALRGTGDWETLPRGPDVLPRRPR